jgi:hypothetical protein
MFPTVPNQLPSIEHIRRCKATLGRFIYERRQDGHPDLAIFGAFMNVYMWLGSQAVGAVNLADRMESWDPEYQAKLREVGLRSTFELDDEEGHVYVALSADRPFGIMGRRNAVGDLFVSGIVDWSQTDFATAVESIKQFGGAELILGSEAEELLGKMEQVTGPLPRIDRTEIGK